MVQIIHSGDNTQRVEFILKAAQKRFGLYGMEKTTMKEIAKDVGISKASLYYYFPDKEHIYKKVVEIEQEIFFEMAEDIMKNSSDPVFILKSFAGIRLNYFKTFFNLSRLRLEEFKHMKPILEDTMVKFRKREAEALEKILQIGIDQKIFNIENPQKVAVLLLETIKGISSLVFHNKELMYVDQDEFDILKNKISDLTEIFIRSLKYKNEESIK